MPSSFLASLSFAERDALQSALSPGVGSALQKHLEALEELSEPPLVHHGRPTTQAPASTSVLGAGVTRAPERPTSSCNTGRGESREQVASFGPPHASLVSRPQLQLLAPALLPEARQWLEEQDREARRQGVQHQQAKELARYCAHLQQLDLDRSKERAESERLILRQRMALLRGAKHIQALRVECAARQAAEEKASARIRELERGLRRALRPSGLAATNAASAVRPMHAKP